ncbi:protein-L-isoaspartate O-methyltransferase family protein [Halosolutus halophilus]|uniref:protein-L-isoaspartate O-methyltransferase family protein n=1 Tax=Halosolutus halophilus TaxID=1552990 RepID=UPI002234ED2A|nr:protein-L-isoaspartate O-methyltransferase [Halosolutus halophilus]
MDPAVLRDDLIDGLASPPKNVLTDDAVAVAMRDVPRHVFVDDERTAYADRAHEILGTRVLAPSTVARLLQALSLDGDEEVLIVGVGVGYTAAVVADVVGETRVHAVDISRPLVIEARENLAEAGYDGVLVDCRDGAEGFPEYAPFDRILLEAAAVEPPRALREQLRDDGRLVFPRGTHRQRLEAITADGETESFAAVSFDPLLVEGEQSGAVERNRMAREDREHAQRRAESRRGWEHEWIEWDDAIDSPSRSD